MKFNVMKFLRSKVIPARGCTEPIAVSLAVSLAYGALYGKLPKFLGSNSKHDIPSPDIDKIKELTVRLDRSTFKNAYAVNIPKTNGKRGVAIAAAMGLYCESDKKLDLLSNLSKDEKRGIDRFLKHGKIRIEIANKDKNPGLYIEVALKYLTGEGMKKALVKIQSEHTNVVYLEVDGKVLYRGSALAATEKENFPKSISQLIKIVKHLTPEEKDEVYRGIVMNKKILNEGLRKSYGLGVSKSLQNLVDKGMLKKDLITDIRIKTGAAEDARVGGVDMPAMSTTGSGSQGIVASVPIIVTAEGCRYDKDRLIEAVMLSHLVTKYVNNYIGYLSAMCGCSIKASIGATAGIVYYLGGNGKHINNAINILAANITGIICDGAKESCALKVSTAAGLAAESALMAMNGMKVESYNGIVEERAEETIENIGRISEAMADTDSMILDVIIKD